METFQMPLAPIQHMPHSCDMTAKIESVLEPLRLHSLAPAEADNSQEKFPPSLPCCALGERICLLSDRTNTPSPVTLQATFLENLLTAIQPDPTYIVVSFSLTPKWHFGTVLP